VQRPLATVVIGGLLVATFLTLFVLPVLYILLNKIKSSATIKSIFIPFFIFLSIGNCVHAQSTISLKAAIDSALKNNLLLKNQQYLTDYYQQLQKSAYEIPNPSLGFEYGQINSSFLDKRFGITQTIAFPTVYKQQHILQKQYMEQSTINAMAKQKDIEKQITQLFFQINYLKEKNKLLTIYDSLYKEVISKIKFKLQKGDADVIELNNTLLIEEQLILQLSKLKSDLDIAILQFNWLLNTQDSYIPDPDILKLSVPLIIDTQAVETHPEVASLIKQKSIIQTHYALEKARLIPSLNFGYYTMSMIGQGADNIYYNAKKQFQSILFGLNFPVFLKAPLSKIKAEKIQISIAENQLAYKSSELKNELKKEIVKVKNQLNVIKFYEQTSLSKIDELIKINNIKYYNGTISYPEWVSYLNNTIITRSNYLDAINELNQTIIQINYLTNQ
jgi:cobalt-zinc-cadmium resistance protein CzcA